MFSLSAFIHTAGTYGFPVRFLQEVASSGYTVRTGPITATWPWLNVMTLEQADVDALENMRPSRVGAGSGILNVFHECTHAWLDINKTRADVMNLVSTGTAYYQRAPLREGAKADDPERIFQEAIAEYVGNRAATYWNGIEAMMRATETADKNRNREDKLSHVLQRAIRARAQYERDMAQQTFGYQTQCPWCAQQPTTKLISTSIKQFADHVLLEDKFADGFARSGRPFQIWKKLQSDYAPRLNGR